MDTNNLFLAIVLSILILAGFQYFYAQPQRHTEQQMQVQKLVQDVRETNTASPSKLQPRADALKQDPRVPILTPELRGSIDLKGARFDDLLLMHYRETVEPDSPPVTLLSPTGSAAPNLAYYAEFGWLADAGIVVPSDETLWKAEGDSLTPQHPLTLSWSNGQGLIFTRTISIDDHYMFTISDSVHNTGAAPVALYPFGLVMHQGDPVKSSSRILHEGPLGVLGGTLQEYTYKELMNGGKKAADSKGGWLGVTDKYWLVAMIVPGDEKLTADFSYNAAGEKDPLMGDFQADFRSLAITIAPGATADHKVMLFAGAKQQSLLEHYQDQLNIPLFDRAIDFGWFWFLTIPFLHLLSFLSRLFGSFAIAILVFTIGLKLVTLPLSLKSNHSMSRMRLLQPEMQRIKERYADDKVKQSQEMMELYKREGINPLAGCVPTLIQIPIFFALYKVIYIGLEMRQAPFFGWVKDMSAPDPSSVFTLFGLIHWAPPLAMQIGIWPVLMGCSMFLQQRMSPQPPDRSQARMFMFMPVLFTYMLRTMPVGLVIYWTWSNLLSIAQQWYIMRQDLKRRGKLGKL